MAPMTVTLAVTYHDPQGRMHEQIKRGKANILVLLDGSDSFSVQSGFNAASLVTQKLGFDLAAEKISAPGKSVSLPIVTNARVLYNPDLLGAYNIVPGLIANAALQQGIGVTVGLTLLVAAVVRLILMGLARV